MKKLISILLSLVMLLSFASCNNISQEDYNDLQKQLDEQKAFAASQQEEILSLKGKITSLTSDINIKDADIEGKTAQINNLISKNEELQAFYDEWEEYVNREIIELFDVGGWYPSRIEDLPEYEEGSIALFDRRKEFEQSNQMTDCYQYDRAYRLCYYESRLPLESALEVVRGLETTTKSKTKLAHPRLFRTDGVRDGFVHNEPIIHQYTWFILAYNVTREEMEQIVDILSDLNNSVYNDWYRDNVDFTHELWELPNVDILYTFDADIINEYYRYA